MFSTNKRLNVFNMLYLTILRKCPESCVLIKTVWERPSQSWIATLNLETLDTHPFVDLGTFSRNLALISLLKSFWAPSFMPATTRILWSVLCWHYLWSALDYEHRGTWHISYLISVAMDDIMHNAPYVQNCLHPYDAQFPTNAPPPLNIIFLLHF